MCIRDSCWSRDNWAQLSRDQQSLNEKKIEHEINKISLNEILNVKGDFETNKEQNLIGFWNHKLNKNINEGLDKNLSLKNLILQKSIKKSQANSFLAQKKAKYLYQQYIIKYIFQGWFSNN